VRQAIDIRVIAHAQEIYYFAFVPPWLDSLVLRKPRVKPPMPLSIEKKDLSGLTVLITGANIGKYNPSTGNLIPA
jgi:hypothetical protein